MNGNDGSRDSAPPSRREEPRGPRHAGNPAGAAPASPASHLEENIHSHDPEVLLGVATNAHLTEDLALALLARRDVQEQVLDLLAKNGAVMKHRKVLHALVRHPRTPRHVSIPIARRLFTFELMDLALTPSLAADLKLVVEEALISRLESISTGERSSLARRASTRVAAALLLDVEARIVEAALQNSHLTEAWVVKALMRDNSPAHLAEIVSHDAKWSLRHEVRLALLHNQHTPLARAILVAESLPVQAVQDALDRSRLPENVRSYLQQQLAKRGSARAGDAS